MVENVIIMGAAGRDFHNFNVYFRDNKRYNVVCFTATQIPDIDGRQYPAEIAGSMYPNGIPIESDDKLMDLIKENKIDLVAFSYSDIPHMEVMHKASQATAAGADFIIIGAPYTMLESSKRWYRFVLFAPEAENRRPADKSYRCSRMQGKRSFPCVIPCLMVI